MGSGQHIRGTPRGRVLGSVQPETRWGGGGGTQASTSGASDGLFIAESVQISVVVFFF